VIAVINSIGEFEIYDEKICAVQMRFVQIAKNIKDN
jgi:hypothetical protein